MSQANEVVIPTPKEIVTVKRWPVVLDQETQTTVYMRRLPVDIAERFADKVLELVVNSQVIGENITEAYFSQSSFANILPILIGPIASSAKARSILTELLVTPNAKGRVVLEWEDGTPVTQDDVDDPDKFPLSSIPALMIGLWRHPDLLYFLSQGRSLWEMVIAQNPSLREVTAKIRSTLLGTPSDTNQNPSPTEDGGNDPTTSSGPVTD